MRRRISHVQRVGLYLPSAFYISPFRTLLLIVTGMDFSIPAGRLYIPALRLYRLAARLHGLTARMQNAGFVMLVCNFAVLSV